MAMTLLELKNYLKSSRGLTRGRNDGLLTDSLLQEGIGNAIEKVGRDNDLLPTTQKVPVVAGQWKVPIPENVTSIIGIYREDTNGSRLPLLSITQQQFDAGRDPSTDLALNPSQYAYPIYEGRPYQWYVKAPPNTDYTPTSRITAGSRRTIQDSGANFGKTWSGVRISPGDMVTNTPYDTPDAQSYGYVEVLDTITAKRNGGADAGTDSTKLVLDGAALSTFDVQVDDVIFSPATGVVKTYAFITEVDGTTAYYEDIRGELAAFAVATSVKIGRANKIRLSADPPHRGLRNGARNYFSVASVSATLTATTFSDTRCTGSGSLTNAEDGQEAIAAGGSHGYITDIGANYVDVTSWHGGVPVNGEVVEVKSCDAYSIETEPRIQPVMYLRPTPSTSDAAGEEKLVVEFDIIPFVPTEDWQMIDIPPKYEDALRTCAEWQIARLTGTHSPAQVAQYKEVYDGETREHRSDIHEAPRSEIMTVWGNRFANRGQLGQANQGVNSGNVYDTSWLLDQNE